MQPVIIKSNRKTLSLQINRDLQVVVRAPRWMRDKTILAFVAQKQDWIDKNLAVVKARLQEEQNRTFFTPGEVQTMKDELRQILPSRVAFWAQKLEVTYNRITVKALTSRWGSCSAKGNLNFNCLLARVPEAVRDYVIIHELCHRVHLNHSPAFWAMVARYCPDYPTHRAFLRHSELIQCLPRT